MDGVVVAHVRGGKVFSYKVVNPITKLVMISCNESTVLVIQCISDVEYNIASITVGRDVWGIYYVA